MEGATSFNRFISAVSENNKENVSQLISSLKLTKAEQFRTFCLAVFHDRTEIVEIMLRNEFKFLDENAGKCAALQLAVHNDNITIIQILLEKGVDIDSSLEKSILYLATCQDNATVIRLLLDRGVDILAKVRGPFSCIHIAVEKECLNVLEFLLRNGAHADSKYPSYNDSEGGDSLLQRAVEKGSKALVELLFKFNVDVSVKSRNGANLLHIAAERGFKKIADSLIKAGADIHELTTPNTNRDYFLEKFNENKEIMFFLNIETPSTPDVVLTNEAVLPLHVAVMNSCENMVKLLLEHNADIDAEDGDGNSVLRTAVEKGTLSVVDLVLSYSPNVSLTRNREALNFAVLSDRDFNAEIVGKLLHNGFKVVTENADIHELLYDAVCYEYTEIVDDLLDKGGDVNKLYSEERDENFELKYLEHTLLHLALQNDSDDMIKFLINRGADVNIKSFEAQSPILYSVENENFEITKLLIDKGACLKNKPRILITAVQKNLLEIIQLLISKGVDVNDSVHFDQKSFSLAAYEPVTPDSSRNHVKSALFIAAESGYKEAVELLVQNGAKMDFNTIYGLNPLLIAMINGHYEVVNLLLKLGASLDNFSTADSGTRNALHLAAELGLKDMVGLLIRYGAEVNYGARCLGDETPLFFSCKNNHFEVVDLLLKFGADICAVNKQGRTPFFFAAKNGQCEMVRFLLDRGAELEAQDEYGYTPLLISAAEGHLKCVDVLLKCGANIHHAKNHGWTALHFAASCNYVDIVNLCIQYGVKINAKTDEHYTPLILASWEGHLDIVACLLKAGANPNITTEFINITPLVFASREGHHEIVKLLLKFGARPNPAFRCKDDDSPVCQAAAENHIHIVETLMKAGVKNDLCSKACSIAAGKSHDAIVELLLDNGANLDPEPFFLNYAEKGNLKFIEALLRQGASVNITDYDGRTALHLAAEHGHLYLVELLLDNGAEVDAKTENDATPLHFSAAGGHLKIVEVLLKKNSNIDSADCFNRTALFLAAAKGHTKIVKFLLESGATVNPAAESKTDKTPLLAASEKGYFEIVDLLLQYGAKADSKDKDGLTALYFAVEFGQEKVAEMLMEKRVSIDCQTTKGLPLILIVAERGHLQTLEILLKFGVDVNLFGIPELKKYYGDKIRKWNPQIFQCILDFSYITKDCGYTDSDDLSEFNIPPLFGILNDVDIRFLRNNHNELSNYNKLAEILVYHTVKMEAANLYVKEGDLVSTVFSDESQIKTFQISCTAEVERMKSDCIANTDVSFYSILTASFYQLARLAKNCHIVKYFTSADNNLEVKLPIYASIIKGQFEKGRMGKALQDEVSKALFRSPLWDNLSPNADPVACIEEIISYLSVKDLRNVDLAFPCNEIVT